MAAAPKGRLSGGPGSVLRLTGHAATPSSRGGVAHMMVMKTEMAQ